MPSAKRPVRKSGPSGKAKAASSAKVRASRTSTRKAARKPAPAKKPAARAKPALTKPQPKSPAKAPVATRAKASAAKTPAKAAKVAAPKAPVGPAAKASTPKAPVVREMIVRTTPGLVKTGGRKPMPAMRKATRRALDVYDPNALIHGIRPYQPQMGEAYMSPAQLAHFRMILQAWKRELMEEVDRTVHHMQDEASNFPDPNDRATQESEFGLELRTRDRERKLLKKIDAALERIEDGSYGYCEETGEEIGLKRLEARPVATLSLEAQERREMAERQYGERDDRYR
jgi:DnaK suppressor protein